MGVGGGDDGQKKGFTQPSPKDEAGKSCVGALVRVQSPSISGLHIKKQRRGSGPGTGVNRYLVSLHSEGTQ